MSNNEEVEPIPLGALSGAVLTWERPDGTIERVKFAED